MTIIDSIRREFLIGFHHPRNTFRESVAPLFFQYADLLLRQANTIKDSNSKEYKDLLKKARATTERFKQAELQDYFQDECIEEATKGLDEDPFPNTAIIYPIILQDRLEILISIEDTIERIIVDEVSGEKIIDTIHKFRKGLVLDDDERTTSDYKEPGKQLYNWVIRKIERLLFKKKYQKPDTLVFVPDGALRTIPMGALIDAQNINGKVEEKYLIQKYAVATVPGLTLTDTTVVKRSMLKPIAMGLNDKSIPYAEVEAQEVVKKIYKQLT